MKKKHPGPALRVVRRRYELAQKALGEFIGRSQTFIANFERGRVEATESELAGMRSALAAHRARLKAAS